MKTKFSVVLTALLMLFCMGANAQIEGAVYDKDGHVIIDGVDQVIDGIMESSSQTNLDLNKDKKVNVADVVEYYKITSVNLIIKNKSSQTVTIAPRFEFVLSGGITNAIWFGEAITDYITMTSDQTMEYHNVKMLNCEKFEGQTFANDAQLGGHKSNVTLYDRSYNSGTIIPVKISSSVVFVNDGTYEIEIDNNSIQSSTSVDPVDPGTVDPVTPGPVEPENPEPVVPVNPEPVNPSAGNPVIRFGVNIVNNTGSAVTLDGRLRFVLGNPDHNGTYYGGYMGHYLRTDNIYFSTVPVTLAPGDSKQFYNLSWQDGDTGYGLGETSPLNPGYLPILDDRGGVAYARNVLIYVNNRSDLILCDNMPNNIIFKDGGLYDIVISGGSAPAPQPVSGGTNPVISFGVKITNAHGSGLTLDGRLRFVLGNPDHNGTYYGGYMGNYLRTDNIWFSSSAVYIAPGDTKTFWGLSWRDADTGCGLGETSPLNPGRLPILDDHGGIAYARNVLMYIGGRSDLILCDNLSAGTIFQEGGLYDIVIR